MVPQRKNITRVLPEQDTLMPETPLPSEIYVPRKMPHILTTWDMTTLFVVSVYLASCSTTAVTAGPAALTYLLLTGITFFVPCLLATAQLGTLFPYAGALYNWTHKALGGYWSFFAGFCAWLPCVLISTSLADLFVLYIQKIHSGWLAAPWQQGLAICCILTLTCLLALRRFRKVQNIINLLVCLMLLGTLLIGFSAIVWLISGHHSATNLTHWSAWNLSPDNFMLFGLISFAYIGVDAPLNLAGETVGRRPPIKSHLLLGALLICFVYLVDTLAILFVQGQNAANDPFALVTLVDSILGPVAGYIVAACQMGSFIATLLVYSHVYARLLLVASVDHRLPAAVGKLSKRRVPANAIVFQTILSLVFTLFTFILSPEIAPAKDQADFSNAVYSVSQAAATLVWAIAAAFLFINLIAYYKRDRANLRRRRICPMPILWISIVVGLLSCSVTIIDTLFFSWTPLINTLQWWYLVGGLMLIFLLIAAIGSMIARSEAEWQDIIGTSIAREEK
ncbi:APC family permease [Ktedonosporobacter rubrisoli]|uniref:APC family permease n=1 Tax=Ktedonosporobacter rubrisoli TaxID=2509675 RepID=A0A4P6JX20_KTERU|nr:APC family permease [Ktedonosporobacter rubrisoli]QBD80164.1 APC family permease [Ktedonosporobacter rubrisoli]